MREYGYVVTGSEAKISDYTSVTFLSEDLLVVAINQKVPKYRFIAGPGRSDNPPSTLLAVSVSSGKVRAKVDIPLEKSWGSLQALAGERFAIVNTNGLQVCDSSLACKPVMSVAPPLRVSPMGRTLALGGYVGIPTMLVDGFTLKQLSVYDYPLSGVVQTVSPGDKAVLVTHGGQVALRGLDGTLISTFSDSKLVKMRFLGLAYAGSFRFQLHKAFVSELSGQRQFEYDVDDTNKSAFLTCLMGKRFGIYEHGYTRLNSLMNLLDIENTRQENFERVRVIELPSGAEKASLEWDPLSRSTAPALSPSGSKLARIRGGYLEVVSLN